MSLKLINLKLLKFDMEAKGWTISSFLFTYRNTPYIVLVKLYLEDEAKPDKYALVNLHFMRADDLTNDLDVPANSSRLFVSAQELRNYFAIQYTENLGDLFEQFYSRLGEAIPSSVPDRYTADEKAAMVRSLSQSDSEDPSKIYCYMVRHNAKKADGTPGQRSAFNSDKTKLLRPELYKELCTDSTVSFCFSSDPSMERDNTTILSNWAKQNET